MPGTPSLAEVIRDAIKAQLDEVMVATVGRVQTYDPVTQTCEVQPVVQRPVKVAGKTVHESFPVLPDVPVLWPRAGGFFIHLPLRPGDHVLLLFTHDSPAMWRETGSESEPGDLRRHHLSHAVAIAGIAPQTSPLLDPPLPGMDPTEAVLGGGVYRIGSKTVSVPVALGPVVDAFIELFKLHRHGSGVGPTTSPIEQWLGGSTQAKKLKAE